MDDFNEIRRRALEKQLRRHLRGEARFDAMSRRLYSTDASIYQIEPMGVVLPRSLDDLQTAVQIALEMHVPIIPRGGGTSLSGQSIGPGLVVDCSKYLNHILELDPERRFARVEPGVVLDQLNRAALPHGLQFGPEVATSNRANLGGMIGNNSAGSRSIVYGKTIDHVLALRAILSDGAMTRFEPLTPDQWQTRASAPTFDGLLHRQLAGIVADHAPAIRQRFPKILRRVSGYNLDVLVDPTDPVGLHQLLVGSEGTLAVLAEAELRLVPRPRHRGLLLPHFDSLTACVDAVAICLEARPTAVELLDQMLLDLAHGNLALRETMASIVGRPAALLMVEFSSDDEAEVHDRIEKLRRRLEGTVGMSAAVVAVEPALRDRLWNLRKASMPLLLGMPGDRKPVTFVEDTAVAPAKLPEFVARFRDILRRHGTDGAFYGHASVGCLHIRPLLDLKDVHEVARMRRITEDVTDLVLAFGGALSGEHGDGLARSEWNRKMFGDEVYDAFRAVKHAFDPHGLFNPGKIVDAPPMTDNLRYGPGYAPQSPPTVFDYRRQGGFVRAVELCNGSGACRKLAGGTMCPSFQATRDERDSTRGRANALRLALVGEHPFDALRRRDLFDVFDLCLSCKACKAECPSNVDVAKLKAEFLHLYYQGRSRPLGQTAMARVHRWNRLAAPIAPLVNWMGRSRPLRWLAEKLVGIDRRRSLPTLHAAHFRRWFARHAPAPSAGRYGRVVLLDDCLTTYFEPAIGRAAVRVLEAAGYAVELAGLPCCGRPLVSKGFLDEARDLARGQLPRLARRAAAGVPILGLEPSCLAMLADDWTELVPGDDSRLVADAARHADAWLADRAANGRCDLRLRPRDAVCLVHGHCHQKALTGVAGTRRALELVPELRVQLLDTGCCGMAGTFGYERQHFDLSVAIANLALLPALKSQPDAAVVAPGTSCRHQILDLEGRHALHPMELLAEQIDEPSR
jgi:FAD/FMN-containing dehydrogenase/Fe-S oxidoreductase